jgi:RNA polymerase sigma-70 factor, ECF subfamily
MTFPVRAAPLLATAPPASFEEAYRDYAQCAARWAHSLGGSSVDAEDVVQEVFLVVSRRLDSFRPEARFTSWLFEITRKVVANHRRRQRWRFWRDRSQEAVGSLATRHLDPVAELERKQETDRLYRALDHLPEKYRSVLVLYEVEGLSTQAIADLRQIKLPTIKVHLHRARERFIKHYQQLLKDDKPRGTP